MKQVISSIILVASSFVSAFAVAECTHNRNAGIVITKPDSLYTDHGDGTVTDNATGLMWQKCSLGLSASDCLIGSAQTYTWQTALSAAAANTDNGYSDWRLPNKNELKSLVEDACFSPAINTSIFPNTVASVYWSSSPYADVNDVAWNVSFNYGVVNGLSKGSSNYVRLVRGSQ